MLTPAFGYLQFFKNLLTTWLKELLDHADDTVGGLLKSEESLADPLDRASFESNRSTTLRIRDRERMLIKKIRKSLEDIENGDYGICEDCGEDISIERYDPRKHQAAGTGSADRPMPVC